MQIKNFKLVARFYNIILFGRKRAFLDLTITLDVIEEDETRYNLTSSNPTQISGEKFDVMSMASI